MVDCGTIVSGAGIVEGRNGAPAESVTRDKLERAESGVGGRTVAGGDRVGAGGIVEGGEKVGGIDGVVAGAIVDAAGIVDCGGTVEGG
jgi:hypothetical protein